jgi:hypothetical protein
MNNFIKQVIEEKFASKAQQRFFYAKANEKGVSKKEKKKWEKYAKEFSKDTNYDKIPEKVTDEEKEVDEIVDDKGNIKRGSKATNFNAKGITSKKTTDKTVKAVGGSQGTHGVHGTHTSLRYWAEADMSKSLGYDDTLGDDENFKKAYKHFTDELGLTHDDAMKRLGDMGYDEKLPEDKVRLVENPKKFMKDYVETVLTKKTDSKEIVNDSKKDINPIVKRQLTSLKNSLKSHNLTLSDIKDFLEEDE